jgi:ketosteroid isomerase-like protein
MRRSLLAVSAVLLSAATCNSSAPAALTDQDKAAINKATEAYANGVNAKDWAGITGAYFTDDAVVMPSNGPTVTGKAAIQALMTSLPPISDFTLRTVEIEGGGSTAYVVGRYALKMMPPGGAAIADSGKYLEIWKKGADGSWHVARDIFNSDVPMPMPDTTSKVDLKVRLPIKLPQILKKK